jgi:hypothetical protein
MDFANFRVRKLDNTKGELTLAKKEWASPEFISSDDLWLVTFELEGEQHQAGVMRGRRVDVANGTEQFDVQLRVSEKAFDADKFIPEWDVAEITKAISEKFLKGEFWKRC